MQADEFMIERFGKRYRAAVRQRMRVWHNRHQFIFSIALHFQIVAIRHLGKDADVGQIVGHPALQGNEGR